MTDHAIDKKHPWHLVEPSAWPLIAGIAGLVAAIGGVIFFHSDNYILLVIGLILMMVVFMGWWREVIKEGENKRDHTAEVSTGLRIGMLLFIASEVMFFFAFFWAFFHSSLPILSNVAVPWPPEGIAAPGAEFSGIPFVNTLILLTSGATVTVAHHALIDGNRETVVRWTGITVLLGILFLGLQVYEYGVLPFGLKDGIYPSTFYLATGFHGFHVFVGTIFLIVCYFRAKKGHFTPTQHIGYEAAAWYWHFVDVVWLFLFINVYWWGSAPWGHLQP